MKLFHFAQKLESIIEKSFFPDLEKLNIQQAYNAALKSNDLEAIKDLYSKYSSLVTRSSRDKFTPSK